MHPRISVIIPVYNSRKTLALCLSSVYAQTTMPDEVIVADDRSVDDSREIAARFGCTVVTAAVNGGVSAARNLGVRASTGDILFFLDSDTALAPDAIEQAVRILDEDPSCGCVHSVLAPVPLIDDGPIEWCRTMDIHHARQRGVGTTLTAHFAAAAVRRSVYTEIGPFDERLRDYEDVEYSERLIGRHGVRVSDRVVASHDEEDSLGPLLREQFRRAQLMGPFAAAHRRRKGALWQFSATAMLLAVLTLATLPALLLSWRLVLLPLICLTGFVVAYAGLLRVAVRQRGLRFVPVVIGLQWLLNVTIVAGALTGMLKAAANHDFGRTTARTRSSTR